MDEQLNSLIAEWKAQESLANSIAEDLQDAKAALRALGVKVSKLKYGIDVGSTVQNDRYGVCRVTSVGPVDVGTFAVKPWLQGNPRKANGEWSQDVRRLYSHWEPIHGSKTTVAAGA